MNRRGFLGMLGKLVAVGAAIGVSPTLIAPAEKKIAEWTCEWIQVGGPDITVPQPEGTCFAFELTITGSPDGVEPQWMTDMKAVEEHIKKIEIKRSVTLAS